MRWGRILWLILTLALCVPAAHAGENIAQSRKELKQILEQLKAQDEQLKKVQGEEKGLLSELERLDKSLAEGGKKLEALRQNIATTEKSLGRNRKDAAQATEEARKEGKRLAAHVRLLYGMGEEGVLKLALSGRHKSRVTQSIQYFGFLIRARKERMAAFRDSVVRLDRFLKEGKNLLARQKKLAETQAAEQHSLESNRQDRQGFLDKVRKERSLQEAKVAELNQAKENLNGFISRLEAAIAKSKLEAVTRKGGEPGELTPEEALIEPGGPARGGDKEPRAMEFGSGGEGKSKERISARRGRLSPPTRARAVSEDPGLLFKAESGAKVAAIHQGHVVFSDWFRGFGQLLILDHGEHVFSLYGHNRKMLVSQGDWVNEGQTIAEVGETGSLQGEGLYFELRQNGTAVNPETWLARKGSG